MGERGPLGSHSGDPEQGIEDASDGIVPLSSVFYLKRNVEVFNLPLLVVPPQVASNVPFVCQVEHYGSKGECLWVLWSLRGPDTASAERTV